MRTKAPQFELPLDGDTFRLVGETAVDGERVAREAREQEENRAASDAMQLDAFEK